MYDSVWIITHHELNKIVTESLGTETNNFKPLMQPPARKRKQEMDMVVVLINKFGWTFLHPWHKGLPKWIPSKTIFIMQVVFMDATPDMLPNKINVNLKVQ